MGYQTLEPLEDEENEEILEGKFGPENPTTTIKTTDNIQIDEKESKNTVPEPQELPTPPKPEKKIYKKIDISNLKPIKDLHLEPPAWAKKYSQL